LVPQILIGPGESFCLPRLGDVVFKYPDVPVGLVGEAVHEQHHGDLAHRQRRRRGPFRVVVDARRIDVVGVQAAVNPSEVQIPARVLWAVGGSFRRHVDDVEASNN
jgi:hypothetical protein